MGLISYFWYRSGFFSFIFILKTIYQWNKIKLSVIFSWGRDIFLAFFGLCKDLLRMEKMKLMMKLVHILNEKCNNNLFKVFVYHNKKLLFLVCFLYSIFYFLILLTKFHYLKINENLSNKKCIQYFCAYTIWVMALQTGKY